MANLSQLKSQARRLEAEGDYKRALHLYLRALRQVERADDGLPDPMLYVRIADLTLRSGEPEEALGRYREAARHFTEQGLLNNAIAVWTKITRVFEDRSEALRELTSLHLDLKLVAEARAYLLRYVQLLRERDDEEAAVEVVEAFLERESDVEVEELLEDLQGAGAGDGEAEDEEVDVEDPLAGEGSEESGAGAPDSERSASASKASTAGEREGS